MEERKNWYKSNESFFKFIFWLITSVFILLFAAMAATVGPMIAEDPEIPAGMVVYFTVLPIILIAGITAIAIFIHKDAAKRGMNPWMWMTIAVYVPNFIGLIIYFIVRSNHGRKCLSCGKELKNDFKVCPYCGASQSENCQKCGRQTAPEWKSCPYCGNDLKK